MGFTHIWVTFTNYELVLEMFETHFTIRNFFFLRKKKKSLVCTGKQFKKNKLTSFPTDQFTPHACSRPGLHSKICYPVGLVQNVILSSLKRKRTVLG